MHFLAAASMAAQQRIHPGTCTAPSTVHLKLLAHPWVVLRVPHAAGSLFVDPAHALHALGSRPHGNLPHSCGGGCGCGCTLDGGSATCPTSFGNGDGSHGSGGGGGVDHYSGCGCGAGCGNTGGLFGSLNPPVTRFDGGDALTWFFYTVPKPLLSWGRLTVTAL